jgi:KDO2-lipid IV(A) lauroyltransferase
LFWNGTFETMKNDRSESGRSSFASNLPARTIWRIGSWIGFLIGVADVPHRRIVRRNLQFANPAWTRQDIHRLTREIFRHIGVTFLEILQMRCLACDDILSRVRLTGEQYLHQALRQDRGLIIISAHLGNWEMGLQFACCYLNSPITGVARMVRFAPLNRRVQRLRTRFGINVIHKKGALPEMTQTLRRKEVLALLVDQSRRSEGVETLYFGRRVTTTPAVAMLAIRCKSPVLPMFCIRERNGGLRLEVKPAVEIQRSGNLRADLLTNTQRVNDAVEQAVRQYPEQWFWVHKRWKKFYPELYPEYQARRRRRKQRERLRGEP